MGREEGEGEAERMIERETQVCPLMSVKSKTAEKFT